MNELNRDVVALWLLERAANCLRIAKCKEGEDRAGWLEDAKYFEAASIMLQFRGDPIIKLQLDGDEHE